MKIVKLKDDEIIIKRKEYFDMIIEKSILKEKASPFYKYTINDIREYFGLPKIDNKEGNKIFKSEVE